VDGGEAVLVNGVLQGGVGEVGVGGILALGHAWPPAVCQHDSPPQPAIHANGS